jgi:predicted O-linked N-acetylglucosamine transferase (SPINDLY family)
VTALPAAKEGVVTFGCLNNFTKVGRRVVEAWGEILRQTDARGIKSRLIIHAREGSHRARVLGQLAAQGVGRERVEFAGRLSMREYLALYGRVDVGLDPFPYCGGTTTCDALWMGVPVVTLRAGAAMPAVGRGGTSILSNVGLGELVAGDVEGYIRIAVELAGDGARMAALRAGMRARLAASPLMDVRGFVGEIEQAYRGMWAQE